MPPPHARYIYIVRAYVRDVPRFVRACCLIREELSAFFGCGEPRGGKVLNVRCIEFENNEGQRGIVGAGRMDLKGRVNFCLADQWGGCYVM